jgi:hypothetical protein
MNEYIENEMIDEQEVISTEPTVDPENMVLNGDLKKHLPNARAIYSKLREGVHLSIDSDEQYPLYKELETYRSAYTSLFGLMGYELIYNPEGFFYFVYVDSITSNSMTMSRKFALLMYTLIDYLQDNNVDPANAILSETVDLQVFEDVRNHYVDLYQQADLHDLNAVISLIEQMAKRGFCQIRGESKVKFLKPIERFIAATEEVTAQYEQQQSAEYDEDEYSEELDYENEPEELAEEA